MKQFLLLACLATLPTMAHSQFSGAYAPANWTTTRVNTANSNTADFGTVNTTGAPANIVIVGPDGNTNDYSSITYSIVANQTGVVNFSYSISNQDVPEADFLVWGKNGTGIDSVGPSPTGSGNVSFPVTVNQTIFFRVSTIDDQLGALTATISNFSISTPLAITGSPLSVSNGKTERVLRWTTFGEDHTEGFEVQKSEDATSFSTIGLVPAHAKDGKSPIARDYTFSDKSEAKPTLYYRYMQVDRDGHRSYSNVVLVKDAGTMSNAVLRAFPNPLKYTQPLSFNNTQEGTLLLFNSQGVVVHKQLVGKLATITLPTQLPSGTYSTILQSASSRQSGTLVIQ